MRINLTPIGFGIKLKSLFDLVVNIHVSVALNVPFYVFLLLFSLNIPSTWFFFHNVHPNLTWDFL